MFLCSISRWDVEVDNARQLVNESERGDDQIKRAGRKAFNSKSSTYFLPVFIESLNELQSKGGICPRYCELGLNVNQDQLCNSSRTAVCNWNMLHTALAPASGFVPEVSFAIDCEQNSPIVFLIYYLNFIFSRV